MKVRGFRIELGEIEAALVRHAGVRQAVAAVREDEPGDKRLVGYVVAQDSCTPDTGELRAHLRQSLPDYMVPSALVVLERLPLTPNGKVDRRALPAPEGGAGEPAHAPPRTLIEEVLATILQDLLRRPRVGVHDNFFELGGDSLLAMRVVARLRQALGVDLPLRTIFEAPTIAEMARQIPASSADAPARLEEGYI